MKNYLTFLLMFIIQGSVLQRNLPCNNVRKVIYRNNLYSFTLIQSNGYR